MRNQKKTRRSLSRTAVQIIALSLFMAIWAGGAGVPARSCPAIEEMTSVTTVTAEAAVRQPGKSALRDAEEAATAVSYPGEAAFADAADPAGLNAEKKNADQSIPEKIKKRLPDINLPDIDLPDLDFSKIDAKKEKEKLREAVRKMDEIGISPDRLVQRAWKFLNRKDNREKIDEAVEDIRETVQDKTGKAAGQEK